MKNFQEKEVKSLNQILGGIDDEKEEKISRVHFHINFSLNLDGFFDGSLKSSGNINEFDKQDKKPYITK